MTFLAPLALVGWIPLCAALYARLNPRRALIVSFIGGWLFLPLTSIPIAGLVPDLNKSTAIYAGVLLGMALFDRAAFSRWRLSWVDVPVVVWLLTPFVSSLANGLGIYDGLSAVLQQTLNWGIPYGLGRIYFSRVDALRDLAFAILIGGLVYVPLCWLEMLNGPDLHYYVYGVLPDAVGDAFRFGGWRPIVFMSHGLMVAVWMTAASLCGVVLYLSGALARWGRRPSAVVVIVLIGTTFALKSVNAWLLLPFVLVLLLGSVRWQRPWLVWGASALIGFYLLLRLTGLWYGLELGTLTSEILPDKRGSVLFRVVNEIQIAERARLQPIWGWGRWGRAFVGRPGGLPVLAADSLWIMAFGQLGTVGLIALLGVLFLPTLLFTASISPRQWLTLAIAPITACAFVVLVFALDSLANAMPVPMYILAAGGVTGWLVAARGALPEMSQGAAL